MTARKMILIIGLLVGGLIILFIINLFFGGSDIKEELATIIQANKRITSLSEQVSKRKISGNLANTASGILITSASDTQRLSNYYESRYGKVPKEPKLTKEQASSTPEAILENTPAGSEFEVKYIELVKQEVKTSKTTSQSIINKTNKDELRSLLQQVVHNYDLFLEQLR